MSDEVRNAKKDAAWLVVAQGNVVLKELLDLIGEPTDEADAFMRADELVHTVADDEQSARCLIAVLVARLWREANQT